MKTSLYSNARGVIKKIFRNNGYGFIALSSPEEEERDVFFHARDIVGRNEFMHMHIGDIVNCDIYLEERGPIAKDIHIVGDHDTRVWRK